MKKKKMKENWNTSTKKKKHLINKTAMTSYHPKEFNFQKRTICGTIRKIEKKKYITHVKFL